LFKFVNGSKTADIKDGEVMLKIEVDNDALLDKYSFVGDYAPQLWLSEREDNAYWPSDHQTFFDNMKAERKSKSDFRLRFTTRVPLESASDRSQEFFHGKKPVDGVGPELTTLIYPILEDAVDPLE